MREEEFIAKETKYSSKLFHAFMDHNDRKFEKYSSKMLKNMLNWNSKQQNPDQVEDLLKKAKKDNSTPLIQKQNNLVTLSRCEMCNFVDKSRIISETKNFVLVCPKNSKIISRHFTILPKSHVMSFCQLDKQEFAEFKEFKKEITETLSTEKRSPFFCEISFDFKKLRHSCCEVFVIDKISENELKYSVEGLLDELGHETFFY